MGMLLRPSTDMCPKELARDMRGVFQQSHRTAWNKGVPGSPRVRATIDGSGNLAMGLK